MMAAQETPTAHAEMYKENVRRQVERAADRIRDRPDLTGWLYELTQSSIPHKIYEDSTVVGPNTINDSGTKNEEWENELFHNDVLSGFCTICGDEKIERNSKCWNDKCVMSPVFNGRYEDMPSSKKVKHNPHSSEEDTVIAKKLMSNVICPTILTQETSLYLSGADEN